jgi:hypothetical protein
VVSTDPAVLIYAAIEQPKLSCPISSSKRSAPFSPTVFLLLSPAGMGGGLGELDGPIHEEREQVAHDEDRSLHLSIMGVTILRVPNQRVFEEPEAVLEEIHEIVG